ncbi:uncharacterized protein LOC131028606 [Cryptomeria japonica]|uniref:uncharacterized protein LOC131028606 n=1 Tax=Cryptomeria japonica TaxID=3369 RepID=UPI0027DA7293|nr:uncharacterized protein LOC131028606 [Cryptomeria japonica]
MAYLNGDESKMAKALKRQPNWVLQKLGLERNTIQSPKSNKVEEEKGRGEASRLTIPRYSPPHLKNLQQPFRVYNNPLSDVVDNNYEKRDIWKNMPYNENRNQYNYGQCNNHNDERRTNNGEINGNWNDRDMINNVSNNRGNYGNNGNYDNNGNRNNQNGNNNNGGGNNGNNGNGTDYAEQHLINVKNIIEEFEIPREDVFMKLFVQSLIEDAREWYRNLPNRYIGSWQEFVTIFLEEFGEHNDTSFASHELTSIKKNQNESISEFNKSKIHYEILSHKPTTLQQAFKIATTIENNRKATGKIGKRDDPKLYNPRAAKKDEFNQIMDMLKDMKSKKIHNEKPPPYRKQCMIAHGFAEEKDHESEYEPTVNVLSSDPFWGRDEDSSEDEQSSNV